MFQADMVNTMTHLPGPRIIRQEFHHQEDYQMSFYTDLDAGNNAASIFWQFEGQCSNNNVLSSINCGKEKREGRDTQEIIITEQMLQGTDTEIKSVLNNNFIIRNNNPRSAPDPGGTLEFELWSNAWDKNKKQIPRSKWTIGWFPKILHPERYNIDNTTVVKPTRLVFMLCKDSHGKQPYACVNFEQYEELEKRLRTIAPFDLDDIPSPLITHYWSNEDLNTPFNCWYVPFDAVKDLATITRILDVPLEPNQFWNCPMDIQMARCENLLNSFNNPPFDRRVELKKAKSAARAYNKEKGLPSNAPLPHMIAFDPEKLPAWVEKHDTPPEWVKELQ